MSKEKPVVEVGLYYHHAIKEEKSQDFKFRLVVLWASYSSHYSIGIGHIWERAMNRLAPPPKHFNLAGAVLVTPQDEMCGYEYPPNLPMAIILAECL